jgi:hypothetical protein
MLDPMERERRILIWLRGGEPESNGADPYDETAEALLEMGRLAATRLDAEHIGAFRIAIQAEVARHGFGYHPIFREWLRLTDAGPDAVGRTLCDDTERGRYMRSMAPLRQFISRGERADILRSVARRHGLDWTENREAERQR